MAHMSVVPGVATIRKSPIVIVRNFVALQFASAALYMAAASVGYYAEIWRGQAISQVVSYQIAQAVFLFTVEVVLVLYIFLSWYRQTIRITDEQLVYDEGLLFRRHTVVPLSQIALATFSQTILGKLTQYGMVSCTDATGTVILRLSGIAEPQQFVDQLMARQSRLTIPVDPHKLLQEPEHERLERKSTFRWDVKTGAVNRALEKSALKTVAAFLNTDGGHLLLGVGDDQSIVGIHHDYATLVRKDSDGLVNHFGNIFNEMLGAPVRHLVHLEPFAVEGKECMLVSVSPSSRPVYLSDSDKEEFFVRTGNGTTSLKLSEAATYIDTRWGTKK